MRGRVIGLTGGPATGKSTLARLLRRKGAMYLSVDRLAHSLYAPGTALCRRLAREYGRGILGADGGVDRGKLGKRVFAGRASMTRLERLVHPALERAARAALSRLRRRWPVTVVEAGPILFRLGLDRDCDLVVLTSCARGVQISRLSCSRGIGRAEAIRRAASVAGHAASAVRLARRRPPGKVLVVDTSPGMGAARVAAGRAWRAVAWR